ncbi:hydroxymethylbilane synthase [Kineococcus gynurae]|uniref:Porphobilinogen deaminase n=1 Tax=Kineococcus gynurae TaxID=452979 RepID=A0ABV5LTR6_9ACTN
MSPTATDRAVLRLGTRRSALARTQSDWTAELLRGNGWMVELVEITTHGDVSREPLAQIGGTGVFVSALRDALLAGEVDLAVHSLKDLPTAPAEGLTLAAVPGREDPRDVLVARGGLALAGLPSGARVGTGSPRRRALLLDLRPDLDVVAVRGNVDTRLRMVSEGDLDAVVLAAAGLARLGRSGEASELLDAAAVVPAPGQGALAVECRADDTALVAALQALDVPAARRAVAAERAVLARLEVGCSAPVGAHAVETAAGVLRLNVAVGTPEGALLRRVAEAPADSVPAATELGHRVADDLLDGPVPLAPPRRPGGVETPRADPQTPPAAPGGGNSQDHRRPRPDPESGL